MAQDLSRWNSSIKSKRMTQSQVDDMYDFANLVYDVYHSTLHEAAESFIGPLIQVRLHVSSRANMPCFRRSGGVPPPDRRILVIVSRVHFLHKGILNHLKKRWELLTAGTLTRL